MDSMIVVALILGSIVLLKYIFKLDIKKAEPLKENKELEKFTDKFPENVQIAKEILSMLGNNKVKIEEAKNTQTSLYIAVTDKISIADMKNNYARIQTIAHECMHSIQDRRLLLFNFIFSNISMLYWLIIIVLTITNVVQNTTIQFFILTLIALIKFVVRGYLEIDAMTKSRYIAKEYIESKHILNKKEEESLIEEYDKINRLGIPFTTVQILITSLLAIFAYAIVTLF